MDTNLFVLKNTLCSYDKKKVVLEIKELNILRGEVVFFVGPSGVGKSTILETLGMMNNTILSSSMFEYNGIDMSSMWLNKNRNKLSHLRNNEFSFIFQQNNLMPNFSAYENAMTAALFQGQSQMHTRKKVREVFSRLNLPIEDRYIYEYSGGQQQRIAFARAIIPNFTILFGDEPTGNLDSNSADKLIGILASVIKEKHLTAVIVSHDMHLAIKYADRIVQIQKRVQEDGQVYGLIDINSIYAKSDNQWQHIFKQYSNEELFNKLMTELK